MRLRYDKPARRWIDVIVVNSWKRRIIGKFFAAQLNLLRKNVKIHKNSNEFCKKICKIRGENLN